MSTNYRHGFQTIGELKKHCMVFDMLNNKFINNNKCHIGGGVPLHYDFSEKKIYLDSEDTHTLVFGATGSLKTRTVVMPTIKMLEKANESMIINDAKGELYAKLSEDLKNQGYRVISLNFREPQTGNSWNPLFIPFQYYIDNDIDKACEIVDDISNNLVKQGYSERDPFWDYSASDLFYALTILLFKLVKKYKLPHELINISSILEIREKLFSSDELHYFLWEEAQDDVLIRAALSGSYLAPNDTKKSILSVFDRKMRMFNTRPTLVKMLANNDIDISLIDEEKTALFIIAPDEKTSLHSLISLFIKESYEYIIYKATNNENNRVNIRVNYILDEFSSIPEISDFPAMITAARSRDIRFLLVTQSLGSLNRRYKEDAETIVSNCSNWIFFTSRELKLLNEISELCGLDNQGKPNISSYELQHLSKEKRQALLLSGRLKPADVRMIDIDELVGPNEKKANINDFKTPRNECKAIDIKEIASEWLLNRQKVQEQFLLNRHPLPEARRPIIETEPGNVTVSDSQINPNNLKKDDKTESSDSKDKINEVNKNNKKDFQEKPDSNKAEKEEKNKFVALLHKKYGKEKLNDKE